MRLKLIILLGILTFLLSSSFAQELPIPLTEGTVIGSISETNPLDRYSFTAEAGQEVTIRMVRIDGELDPRLFLFDANENLITSNDDFGGERNSQITHTVETTGTYLIEASRFATESGTYELSLSISDEVTETIFDTPPNFAVEFSQINYSEEVTGNLDSTRTRQYYVIGSRQGDFLRIELNTTNGDLNANATLYRQDLQIVSRLSQSSPEQKVIFAAIPQTGWYLLEISQQSGSGVFAFSPSLVSDTLLNDTSPTLANFSEANDTLFFVVNATIGERIFVNLTVIGNTRNVVPELQIEDINGNLLVEPRSSTGTQTRLSLIAPRSGPYIVQAKNLGTGEGDIEIGLRRTPVDIGKLVIESALYNESYRGIISDDEPIDYYRLAGKADELVTIRMEAVITDTGLDPYIILADANFNELVFNDNVTASRNAQITQFRLPADGDYYILATRTGLANGTTNGAYSMVINVGELRLEAGRLTATLTWDGLADLNLFVRTPDGYTVSWASPTEPNGGILQIDSNTTCQTPTDQPIEHIYWNTSDLVEGDYTIWVWHQNACRTAEPVPFTLNIEVDGQTLLNTNSVNLQNQTAIRRVIRHGSRFETSIRIDDDGSAVVVNDGTESNPSPQQVASQGGDELIVLGEVVDGSINEIVFARFYQFEAEAGERVLIRVERVTGNLDPVLVLRNAADVNLVSNDDISPTNLNSQLEFEISETGRYVIAVSRYGLRDGTTVGDYRLYLERAR